MFTPLPPGAPRRADCYIFFGEAVMLHETYIHRGENRTGVTRVILFCDIERALSNPVLRRINRTIGRGMIREAATQNLPGEHVRAPNHIFSYVYQIRVLGKRIEHWNKPMHRALARGL